MTTAETIITSLWSQYIHPVIMATNYSQSPDVKPIVMNTATGCINMGQKLIGHEIGTVIIGKNRDSNKCEIAMWCSHYWWYKQGWLSVDTTEFVYHCWKAYNLFLFCCKCFINFLYFFFMSLQWARTQTIQNFDKYMCLITFMNQTVVCEQFNKTKLPV